MKIITLFRMKWKRLTSIDFDKLLKITKTVYVTGWNLANMPKRPAIDKTVPAIDDEE